MIKVGRRGEQIKPSILFHALTLTSADTPKKPRWRKSSGDPGERMPSACPVRPITFFPSRYESMAVRGFERCRNEGCEEGLILFYCTIWTTYHGVIYHACRRGMKKMRSASGGPSPAEWSLGWTSRVVVRRTIRSLGRWIYPLKLLIGHNWARVEHTIESVEHTRWTVGAR